LEVRTGIVAAPLAPRADRLPGTVRSIQYDELIVYNVIHKDNGREAADQWLSREWESI